ncbi:MAG: hypothetical protein KGK34_07275 [Chloroflexota bacterium]|nr:hypothetical protein [Chloroflexota bacterium]
MADSVTASDIVAAFAPGGAAAALHLDLVAGYVDGAFAWSDADWSLFSCPKVRISTSAATSPKVAHVLDVENGDATPDQAVAWIKWARSLGLRRTIYCGANTWAVVKAAFAAAGLAYPDWFVARWTGTPGLIDGTVATQYADPPQTGAHFDASSVADYWPGVDDMTPDQVQAMIDAALAAYAQKLEDVELGPMKGALDTLAGDDADLKAKIAAIGKAAGS